MLALIDEVAKFLDRKEALEADRKRLREALEWAYEAIEGESSLQEDSPITRALAESRKLDGQDEN